MKTRYLGEGFYNKNGISCIFNVYVGDEDDGYYKTYELEEADIVNKEEFEEYLLYIYPEKIYNNVINYPAEKIAKMLYDAGMIDEAEIDIK